MRKQKFRHGDLVRVADDLGPSMEHFTKSCNAIVIGSYADQFGGGNHKSYTIFIEGGGETSWYEEHQLSLIRRDANELLETWKDQAEARTQQESDLKWIRENWETVKTSASATSVLRLFEWIGFKSSFLRNGEYYCLFMDAAKMFPAIERILTAKTREEAESRFEDSEVKRLAGQKFNELELLTK